ncbi:Hypothetical protein C900_04165 [Fulvivirga imtechensis AK7]|uniref:Prokaryotic-type class I peptide chain release factors domain-containing protein n=1 Tax=Fulvivirga imtechensis AK7 TaxID=1237149 RepID=L8JYS3_9BACT|nr:alternative ribosome rescue aminoacyl-tRNA hydrolase ArfB [Fulvivirga imtechensis]ELR73313.1 Hypothetical protein C900_04165 [Fulvivirga imtechensis AK7]
MSQLKPYQKDFSSELNFTTSRSSGPGGQHVNKVNTKVTLRFDIDHSEMLSAEEKAVIKEKLSNKVTNDNFLVISAESERSQLKNKEESIKKFLDLLKQAFKVKKKRKPTKPSKTAVEKRLTEKKKQSEKKQMRQKF